MGIQRDEILDLVRGSSALVVLAAHIRGFLFQDLGTLANPSPMTKAFYFITSIHHEAVMVFFVLSGYFVGGGVIKSLIRGRFSWNAYALARLVRLWVVLVPALFLTLACDFSGNMIAHDAYAGSFRNEWMSGPSPGQSANWGLDTIAGNLLFLQTVQVPVLGSNGPLWSLANEFWYYVLFPLCAVVVAKLWGDRPISSWRLGTALFSLFLACVLTWWLPFGLIKYGIIWLFGVGVWGLFAANRIPSGKNQVAWFICSGIGFVTILMLTKLRVLSESDFWVGFTFALWMISLLGACRYLTCIRTVSKFFADISYTLYVTHFPILFLIFATIFKGEQFDPSLPGYVLFVGLLFISICSATVMWWFFERNTDALRRKLSIGLGLTGEHVSKSSAPDLVRPRIEIDAE